MVGLKYEATRVARAVTLAALLTLLAGAARAGEFYGSFGLAITEVRAEASGANPVAGTPGANSGTSTDTSPLVSGALGFEFRMHELLPRRRRPPAWMPDIDLEDWVLRTEIEAAGARNYDLTVNNTRPASPHRATVEDVTLIVNQWLDLPLGHAIEAVGGRIRGIDDLTFNVGLGIGYVRSTLRTDNAVSFGKSIENGMVWQAGAELGFPLSDSVVLTGGYRFVDLGLHETKLVDSTGTQPQGRLKLDIHSHEFRAGIRLSFYAVRFPRGLFEPKRRYTP